MLLSLFSPKYGLFGQSVLSRSVSTYIHYCLWNKWQKVKSILIIHFSEYTGPRCIQLNTWNRCLPELYIWRLFTDLLSRLLSLPLQGKPLYPWCLNFARRRCKTASSLRATISDGSNMHAELLTFPTRVTSHKSSFCQLNRTREQLQVLKHTHTD